MCRSDCSGFRTSHCVCPLLTTPRCSLAQYNDLVGKGSFKNVYRGWDRETGREVAWCSIRADSLSPQQLGQIRREVQTLAMLDHPTLMQFYHSFYLAPNAVFITELLEGGNLLECVRTPPVLASPAMVAHSRAAGCAPQLLPQVPHQRVPGEALHDGAAAGVEVHARPHAARGAPRSEVRQRFCRRVRCTHTLPCRGCPPLTRCAWRRVWLRRAKGTVKVGDFGLSIQMKDKVLTASVGAWVPALWCCGVVVRDTLPKHPKCRTRHA